MKVSIIIPVYNVEPYVERCIESVLCQTYRELEVIIVDDCTSDHSIELIRKCINCSDSKGLVFKFLKHDKNRGISAARNTGIRAATGDYIFFMDSDDWISENCISLLVEPLKDCLYDFVMGECETRGTDWNLPPRNMRGSMIGTEKIAEAYNLNNWHCSPWNKLCRRSFIIDNDLFFNNVPHEDQLWSAQLACTANSLYFEKETTYFYFIHKNSFMTNESSYEMTENYLKVLSRFYEYLEKKQIFRQEVEGVVEERMKNLLLSVLIMSNPSRYFQYKTLRECDIRSFKTKKLTICFLNGLIKHLDTFVPTPLGFVYKGMIVKLIAFRGRLLNNKLTNYLKGIWYQRRSQYTRTGKIALCSIAKLENDYIRHFVDYYKNLHFDKIFLYDNNDPGGERFEEVISDYIQDDFVEIIDFRGEKVAQMRAYQDCYDRHNKEYDWIAFFDIDEFLTFEDKSIEIHSFLSQKKFRPFQVMHINWKIYGDNDLLDNDGRSVTERFEDPVLPLDFRTRERPWNDHVKSIVRGGLSEVSWNATPHTIISDYYQCCNSEGVLVDINSPFQEIEFKSVFLRHYRTKTIGEWVKNKMVRGFPDQSEIDWKEALSIDQFFEYNKRTEEKTRYVEELLKASL